MALRVQIKGSFESAFVEGTKWRISSYDLCSCEKFAVVKLDDSLPQGSEHGDLDDIDGEIGKVDGAIRTIDGWQGRLCRG